MQKKQFYCINLISIPFYKNHEKTSFKYSMLHERKPQKQIETTNELKKYVEPQKKT